jgi:molecular chaperone HtpG
VFTDIIKQWGASMATAKKNVEKHAFQTEVKQLLHLMVHSLYSHREIFLRELISNAADACDKIRFQSIARPELSAEPLVIRIKPDAEAGTLTVSDNGVGMTKDEVIANLGTIARSGTGEFLRQLSGDEKKDAHLIGQFGVGFYSAFIVADKVVVETRAEGADEAVRWTSSGDGEFTIETGSRTERGTDVILHLKEDAREFLDSLRLREIVHKYSDHIAFEIQMPRTEDDKDKKGGEPEWETVNKAQALWTLPKSEISDEEYKEFYKYIAHDFEDPLAWAHHRVEGKLEYTALLYVPSRAPFDLWNRERTRGLKLYVQRVFIMDDAEQFLPVYLRFVRGIIDSNDLPLNVSREILQDSSVTRSLRSAVTRKVLDMLEHLARQEPEKYQTFWKEFGQVLKEGLAEDFANREQIARLLRFASTHKDTPEETVSLQDYVERMKEGQDAIYYITAESFAAAKNSPHLEIFRKKGIEVLLLTDRIDEWLVGYLGSFDGHPLKSVAKGDLDLGKLQDEEERKAAEKAAEAAGPFLEAIKSALGDSIKEVRFSHRLTDSPACVVLGDNDLGPQMAQILKAAGQEVPQSKPILELNTDHPLVRKMQSLTESEDFADWALLLFEQSLLAERGSLEDPAGFAHRLNKLLLRNS